MGRHKPRKPSIPASGPARVDQALAHIQAGRDEQARAVLLRALQHSPRDPDANSMMCALAARMGEHAQSLFYAQRACEAAPGEPNLLDNLANALLATGDAAGALAAYERALQIDRSRLSSRIGILDSLSRQHDYARAASLGAAWLAEGFDDPRLIANYTAALTHSGRARESVAVLRGAVSRHPDDQRLASVLCGAMNYAGDLPPADVFAAHSHYGALVQRLYGGLNAAPAMPRDADPERPLRLGILSGDLRNHAVGFFVDPLLEQQARGGMQVYCYSTAAAEDGTSARLRSMAAAWRRATGLSIERLATTIRQDRIDVLLELSGHTAGHRLPVFELRPAPLAITYFGYPNTTGLRSIDCRIVDNHTDPDLPEFDALATERLVRLDPCFLCYRPPEGAPEPAPAAPRHGAPGGAVTFGSFNALAKLDDLTVDLWAQVLKVAPASRLLIKNHGLASEGVREQIARRFAAKGIDTARLILEGPGSSALDMLAHYRRLDVALDTFPYHGTTTTCEALYMGVPVVTLAGSVCAARVGISLLEAVGMPELIARTPEQYAQIAAGLAGDPARLDAARADLRRRFLASPAADVPGFAARFEALVRGLWRQRCPVPPATAAGGDHRAGGL
jgi:protein O-GlcNAc transferase